MVVLYAVSIVLLICVSAVTTSHNAQIYHGIKLWKNYRAYSHIPGVIQLGSLTVIPLPKILTPYRKLHLMTLTI